MSSFKEIEILNNFYQTSAFFPMPTVLVSTLNESGMTNLGAYSLCFPYYIAEKEYFAMFLSTRNSSNTAQNILRTKRCAINFIPDKRRYMKEIVRLGFPGETTDEKMRSTLFHLERGERAASDPSGQYPGIVTEAVQVFECTWDDEDTISPNGDGVTYRPPFNRFNGITSTHGAIFILKIDKILLKPKWRKAIVDGNGRMPGMPVDYGFRDNAKFWISRARRPIKYRIPKDKGVGEDVVRAAASNMDSSFTWDEACFTRLKRVPKIFLNTVLRGVFNEARKTGTRHITVEFLDELRDKRTTEKRYH